MNPDPKRIENIYNISHYKLRFLIIFLLISILIYFLY